MAFPDVEDVVAVKVISPEGEAVFFLTWGRIQDPVDPSPLEALVLRHAPGWGVRGVRAELCSSLQEAAAEPHVYEVIFAFSQKRIPYGRETGTGGGSASTATKASEPRHQSRHLWGGGCRAE